MSAYTFIVVDVDCDFCECFEARKQPAMEYAQRPFSLSDTYLALLADLESDGWRFHFGEVYCPKCALKELGD